MIKKPPRKESVDERATSKQWRKLGYIELKIEKCNHDGWPDRWYCSAALGVRFWCEWKRVGEDPFLQQLIKHREIREQGEVVIVAHSTAEFWEQVRRMQDPCNGL